MQPPILALGRPKDKSGIEGGLSGLERCSFKTCLSDQLT